ncbi:hypothetical protein OG948_39350 (plasmid) [Embleya sp. NBC_00888]|uniref:hypothetical protein n=1 Tax=Embleya sp. NBC_00888 TaxID=2975960 RepID=UPI002F9137A8|nr:hypothetical protein OG948_39350 [Embleya sp. NBC_00888]
MAFDSRSTAQADLDDTLRRLDDTRRTGSRGYIPDFFDSTLAVVEFTAVAPPLRPLSRSPPPRLPPPEAP